MVDEDDEEPVLGRNTLKLRSQELVNANHSNARQPLQDYSGQLYQQQQAPPRQPLGQPNAYQQRPPLGQHLGQHPNERGPDKSQWQLTPEMMTQTWGTVLRTMKTGPPELRAR